MAQPQPEPAGDDVLWLDEDEMSAWRGLVETMGDLEAQLDADLIASHGITLGDYGVLVQLSEVPDRQIRMCDLAQRLHLSPSGMTRRLDGLVKAGYVERHPCPGDRRAVYAFLTDAGFAKLEESAPEHVRGVRRHFLDHLNRTQVRQLGAALDALRRYREQKLRTDPDER